MEEKRVFIHHEGALGDILLSYPCIRRIKDEYGLVHMAGKHDVMEFLRETGSIDEASSSDRILYASLHTSSMEMRVKEFLSQFDSAFVFTKNSDSVLAANIRTVIPRTGVINTVPPKGYAMHVGEFRMKQFPEQIKKNNGTLSFDIPSLHRESASDFLTAAGYGGQERPLVALHPGSGGKKKCWPLEYFFILVEKIKHTLDPYFLIFSGPSEYHGIKQEIEVFIRGHEGMVHVCNQGLVRVAALLNLSHAYIGNDSGITHLSARVNRNVVVLFGPTDPFLWKPMGHRVKIISSGSQDSSLLSITVDEVLTAVNDSLSVHYTERN
jgi:heptosyltransferase-3